MARKNTGRILAEELHRVLEEFGDLDDEIRMLVDERKRLATLAHKLLQILRTVVRERVAERLIAEFGLAEMITRLPGVPGRKPAAPVKAKRVKRQPVTAPEPPAKAVTTAEAPEVLEKGTPVKMLAGLYKGWTGLVRSISEKGSRVTYAVALSGPDGKTARTQVTPSSMGKKWVVEGAPVKSGKGKKPVKRKGAAKKKAAGKKRKNPKG